MNPVEYRTHSQRAVQLHRSKKIGTDYINFYFRAFYNN